MWCRHESLFRVNVAPHGVDIDVSLAMLDGQAWVSLGNPMASFMQEETIFRKLAGNQKGVQ